MNVRKLYEYIASKNSSVNKNYIGIFLSSHPECNGALEKLIVSGYVMEVDGLYGGARLQRPVFHRNRIQ